MKIYVAGPYSAPTRHERIANTYAAMDAAIRLIQRGHIPYVPHLSHYLDERAKQAGVDITYDWWLEYDEIWLEHCEAILQIASSPGVDKEVGRALVLGRQVFFDENDIPDAEEEKHD